MGNGSVFRRIALLLGLAVSLAPPVHAEQVRLHFVPAGSWPHTGQGLPGSLHLEIEPIGSLGQPVGELESLHLEIDPTAEAVVDLDPQVAWKLTATGDGVWAGAQEVFPAPGARVAVSLWPRATLGGKLRVPRGEDLPSQLSAQLTTVEQEDQEETLAAEVACDLEEDRWSCTVPATTLDVRLEARGFAPHFLWAMNAGPGETLDLGMISLRKGASIFGWVRGEGDVVLGSGGEVTLTPYLAQKPPGSAREREGSAPTHRARVQGDGFFHLYPVLPGTYVLQATQGEARSVPLYPLVVEENETLELTDPVLLRQPARLRVVLDPPLDPAGHPWTANLSRFGPTEASLVEVEARAFTEDGLYETAELVAGRYMVQIEDSTGARFATEEVELEPGEQSLTITLDLIPVEGQVLLGDEPLEALLAFGGRIGRRHLHMESDAEGEFEGVLPYSGEWRVFVEADEPKVRRTLPAVEVPEPRGGRPARVEIKLPDTSVSGEVVDELGRAVSEARVEVLEFSTGLSTWDVTNEDGQFQLRGLDHGRIILQASARQAARLLESEEVPLLLQPDLEPAPLRLEVREVLRLTGQVLLGEDPAAGALVVAMPRSPGRSLPLDIRRTVADPAGGFDLRIPAYAGQVDLVVLATGGVLTAMQLSPHREDPLLIPVPRGGGGTLILEGLTPPGPPSSSVQQPLVFIDSRVPVDTHLLQQWAHISGVENDSASRLEVPALPPGRYTVCWLTLEEFASLASGDGSALGAASCENSHLPGQGELVISAPSQE